MKTEAENREITTAEILSRCDHTLLAPDATWDEIRETLDDAVSYGTASACIPPCYVGRAKQYVGDRLRICTVNGFPLGYAETSVNMRRGRLCEAAQMRSTWSSTSVRSATADSTV